MKKNKDSFKVWLETKVNKLKRLKPFQGKSTEVILTNIIKSLYIDTEDVKYKLGYLYDTGKNETEKKFLLERLHTYEKDFNFNDSTDLGDLRQILSYELELLRLQEQSKDKDKSDYNLVDIMQKVSNTLRELKLKLGISRSQRSSGKETGIEYITKIKKAAYEYMQKNRDEFSWKCKNCGQMHLLARRHSAFDEQGGIWNMKLVSLYNQKRLSLKEVSEILDTSPEYIKYICQRKKIELRDEEEKTK